MPGLRHNTSAKRVNPKFTSHGTAMDDWCPRQWSFVFQIELRIRARELFTFESQHRDVEAIRRLVADYFCACGDTPLHIAIFHNLLDDKDIAEHNFGTFTSKLIVAINFTAIIFHYMTSGDNVRDPITGNYYTRTAFSIIVSDHQN